MRDTTSRYYYDDPTENAEQEDGGNAGTSTSGSSGTGSSSGTAGGSSESGSGDDDKINPNDHYMPPTNPDNIAWNDFIDHIDLDQLQDLIDSDRYINSLVDEFGDFRDNVSQDQIDLAFESSVYEGHYDDLITDIVDSYGGWENFNIDWDPWNDYSDDFMCDPNFGWMESWVNNRWLGYI